MFRTTCRWRASGMWGGTFNLSVGLGDEEHTPLEFPGPGGALTRRISIGAVDIGWAG